MSNNKALSVVICTYDRSELLQKTLFYLLKDAPRDGSVEVLVVDNNSSDDTKAVVARHAQECPFLRYLFEPLPGLTFARNRGWKESTADFVAYLDDDAIPGKDWVRNIVSIIKRVHPQPCAIGGPIYLYSTPNVPAWMLDSLRFSPWDKEVFLRSFQKDGAFIGANVVIKRSLLENMNGFSPTYGMTGKKLGLGEEIEFFWRVSLTLPDIYKNFFYSPSLAVKHFLHPHRANMRYWLRREFIAGQISMNFDLDRGQILWHFFLGIAGILFLAPLTFLNNYYIRRKFFTALRWVSFSLGYLFGRNFVRKQLFEREETRTVQ